MLYVVPLQMGQNPLSPEIALTILKSIEQSDKCVVHTLDLRVIFVYRKNPKISDIRKCAVITLKVEQNAEGIANSVDPDQTAPRPVCPKT